MHWQAFSFIQTVKSCLPQYFFQNKVVEFGSACVNYSIAELFELPNNYIGVDLISGNGVDIICDAKIVMLGNNFDVSISCECFEHNPYYLETFMNMVNHVRAGGLVLFTCATTGRPEHGTSRTTPEQSPGTTAVGWDYYQNIVEQDFPQEYLKNVFSAYHFFTNSESQDLYFIGIKKGVEQTIPFDLLASTIEVHERLGGYFSRLWSAEKEASFLDEVIDDLLFLEGLSINPYICENTIPLLIQRCERNAEALNKIKQITLQLILQFPANEKALYLMALAENKRSDCNASLSFALRICKNDRTPQLSFLLMSNFYELALYTEAFSVAEQNKILLMSSARWLKINVASKLWQLFLKGQNSGDTLQELCESEANCIELSAILCRYKAAKGFTTEAIRLLKDQLNKSAAPDWVIREYLQLTENELGLEQAKQCFIPFHSQVNNMNNFNKYVT